MHVDPATWPLAYTNMHNDLVFRRRTAEGTVFLLDSDDDAIYGPYTLAEALTKLTSLLGTGWRRVLPPAAPEAPFEIDNCCAEDHVGLESWRTSGEAI